MWNKIATFILKKRLYFIVGIVLFTALMGYFGSKVQLEYNMQKLVPKDDPDFIAYEKFKQTFGEDGNRLVASCSYLPYLSHSKTDFPIKTLNLQIQLCGIKLPPLS